MELMYPKILYIGAVVVFILAFLPFRKKSKYKKGKKIVQPDYIQNDPYYKRKKIIYRVLVFLVKTACVVGILASLLLISRPYVTVVEEKENYNRDIMLCIDISSSVDRLNSTLCDQLKKMVEELEGERFGIVIFNTSPVLLVPLTDDYEYVTDTLDRLSEALDARYRYYETYDYDAYEYSQMAYLDGGVLIGNERRGSSLIGDGLAAAAFNFDHQEEEERVRIIIFSSDNDVYGDQYVTVPEAAAICKRHNIVVYGIGTEEMTEVNMQEMKEAVESTGGEFFLEGESSMRKVVERIQEAGQNMTKGGYETKKVDQMEFPFCILLGSVAVMILLTKRTRL